jgi:hypothetical protein
MHAIHLQTQSLSVTAVSSLAPLPFPGPPNALLAPTLTPPQRPPSEEEEFQAALAASLREYEGRARTPQDAPPRAHRPTPMVGGGGDSDGEGEGGVGASDHDDDVVEVMAPPLAPGFGAGAAVGAGGARGPGAGRHSASGPGTTGAGPQAEDPDLQRAIEASLREMGQH